MRWTPPLWVEFLPSSALLLGSSCMGRGSSGRGRPSLSRHIYRGVLDIFRFLGMFREWLFFSASSHSGIIMARKRPCRLVPRLLAIRRSSLSYWGVRACMNFIILPISLLLGFPRLFIGLDFHGYPAAHAGNLWIVYCYKDVHVHYLTCCIPCSRSS